MLHILLSIVQSIILQLWTATTKDSGRIRCLMDAVLLYIRIFHIIKEILMILSWKRMKDFIFLIMGSIKYKKKLPRKYKKKICYYKKNTRKQQVPIILAAFWTPNLKEREQFVIKESYMKDNGKMEWEKVKGSNIL